MQAKELHDKALQINPNYSGDFQNRLSIASRVSDTQGGTFAPAV